LLHDKKTLQLKLVHKQKIGCRYPEVWLVVEIEGGQKGNALPLFMYVPKKDQDSPHMQVFVDKAIQQIHSALEKSMISCDFGDFQVSVRRSEEMNHEKGASSSSSSSFVSSAAAAAAGPGSRDEIGEALWRLQQLREKGASREEIMAENNHVRQARRRRGGDKETPPQQDTTDTSSNNDKKKKEDEIIEATPVAYFIQGKRYLVDQQRMMEEGLADNHPATTMDKAAAGMGRGFFLQNSKYLVSATIALWFIYRMMRPNYVTT